MLMLLINSFKLIYNNGENIVGLYVLLDWLSKFTGKHLQANE